MFLFVYEYNIFKISIPVAQGGGGSFKNRKFIGEVSWCDTMVFAAMELQPKRKARRRTQRSKASICRLDAPARRSRWKPAEPVLEAPKLDRGAQGRE